MASSETPAATKDTSGKIDLVTPNDPMREVPARARESTPHRKTGSSR